MPKSDRMQHGDGAKVYRGLTIAFNREVPPGRRGRYSVGSRQFAQLGHAREFIDSELQQVG